MTYHQIVKYWPTENRTGIYLHFARNFEMIEKNYLIQLVCVIRVSIDLIKASRP